MTASASLREIQIAHVAINIAGNVISFSVEIVADGSVCDARWPKISETAGDESRTINKSGNHSRDQGLKPLTENTRSKGALKEWIPDTRVYVYHLENDKLQYFDCCELTRQTSLAGGPLDSREVGGT